MASNNPAKQTFSGFREQGPLSRLWHNCGNLYPQWCHNETNRVLRRHDHRLAPQADHRHAARGDGGPRSPRQQAHRVSQAQGPRRPDQLLASRRLLHPRRTRRLRRARPVVLRRGPLLPRRHPDRNRRVVRQPRPGGTLRRRVGQPARGRHPGPAAQARRQRATDAAQARRPVPLLRGRPRAPGPPTARAAPVAGHARTRAAPARGRPDAGGAARRDRVVRQPARRAAAASVRRTRSAQVRVGRRPAHRPTARHRPVDGRRRPAPTRRARRRDRPGAARGRRASADGKKRRKSSPTSKR